MLQGKTCRFGFFSVRNEFGYNYCDALLDAEAGIKVALARYNIDEVVIIGGADAYDEGDDLTPFSLNHGSGLYSADKSTISTFGLLQYRIAQFADELNLEKKTEEERLPLETREKLIQFIKDFQERDAELKSQKGNRLFDALAMNDELYERFWTALYEALPEFREYSGICDQWVKSHLYSELKPSAKLELLHVNEGARIRLIPADQAENNGQWVDSMMTMQKSIVEDQGDIDLYSIIAMTRRIQSMSRSCLRRSGWS